MNLQNLNIKVANSSLATRKRLESTTLMPTLGLFLRRIIVVSFILKVDIASARNWKMASIHLNWRRQAIRQCAFDADSLALFAFSAMRFTVLVDEAKRLCKDSGPTFTLTFGTTGIGKGKVLAVVGDFVFARLVAWRAGVESWRSDGDCGGEEGGENGCGLHCVGV